MQCLRGDYDLKNSIKNIKAWNKQIVEHNYIERAFILIFCEEIGTARYNI